MVRIRRAAIVSCPNCAEKFHLRTRPKLGQKVTCLYCRSHLKVVSLKPLKLDWDFGNLNDEEQVEKYWTEESW